MLTISRRRFGSASALVLALIVGLPALAQAQLFPNLFVQRQRTECANEPPFYKHVRRDYFGYYPTCWRTFPQGWACPCPNPELPNRELSFRNRPPDDKKDLQAPDDLDSPLGDDDGMGTGRPGPRDGGGAGGRDTDPNLPAVPPGTRSPFEMDPKKPLDPFLTPSRPDTTRPTPGAGPRTAPLRDSSRIDPNASSTPADTKPTLDGPAITRPAGVSRRESSPSSEPSVPVLALPEMAPPDSSLPASSPVLTNLPSSLPTTGAYLDTTVPVASAPAPEPATSPAPAQAPRRTSVIGSLFGLGNRSRR